jgi:hypothetical protein
MVFGQEPCRIGVLDVGAIEIEGMRATVACRANAGTFVDDRARACPAAVGSLYQPAVLCGAIFDCSS